MYNKNQNTSPIRVLHVVGTMDRGGAEIWLMSLLRKTDRQVLAMDFLAQHPDKGVFTDEIISLDSKVLSCTLKPYRTFAKRFRKVLREGNYDVVHSHVWLFSGLLMKIAKTCNVPVRITHSHNTQSLHKSSIYYKLYSYWMRHNILKHSTHCIGCSSEAMAALYGTGWHKNPKCRILYCSTDTDLFLPEVKSEVTKESFALPSNAIIIGHVGNFREQKNHTFLLDIAAQLIKLDPHIFFILVGHGPLEEEINKKAVQLNISDHIRFAGTRNDVPGLMTNIFDAFLFPSLFEGLPVTLIEAAAAGLPIICSDTITAEATNIIPELCTRLPLALSAEQWAIHVLHKLQKERFSQEKAYAIVSQSPFSPYNSLMALTKIYGADINKVWKPEPSSSRRPL